MSLPHRIHGVAQSAFQDDIAPPPSVFFLALTGRGRPDQSAMETASTTSHGLKSRSSQLSASCSHSLFGGARGVWIENGELPSS